MAELSNWGRWGPEDELGTLNLITDAKRVEAAALVRTGRTVSLSRDPVVGQAATFQRGFENVFAYGGPGLGERAAWIEEQHRIGYHGSPLTHLDALCHVAWDGMTYNGRRFDETATVADGCTKNGVYPIRDGVVTRGILMSMPGAERVDAGDIEAWERDTGITITAGDALFLWTAGSGGFDNSIMPFLRERDLALLLADSGVVDGGPIEGRTTLPDAHVHARRPRHAPHRRRRPRGPRRHRRRARPLRVPLRHRPVAGPQRRRVRHQPARRVLRRSDVF